MRATLTSPLSPPLAIISGSSEPSAAVSPSMHRRQLQRRKRLHEAEAGGDVIGDHASGDHALAAQMQLDVFSFEDQVADRQYQPVGADHHARALPHRAERLR